MRTVVAVLLTVHGLIHVMGFTKAFGYASFPQLTEPISRWMGVLWLAAGLFLLATAVMFVAWPRNWWIVGTVALLISQTAVMSAWHDAWAGTIVNAVLLVVVTHGWLTEGPWSFRTRFERDIAAGLARPFETHLVTDADLASLPEPVRRYLRVVGVPGQPRVRNYRLRFRGRIRSAPDARWMPFDADQQSFADEPTRLFFMRARMFGLPVEVFHRFMNGRAVMQVKIAGLIPVVDARGAVLDQSETVTLFNDMCLLAPGTLLDPGVRWTPVDAQTARAHFTHAGRTISATLLFNGEGLLVNFISEDRSQASADGQTFRRLRFSTPVRDYRAFGLARLPAHGEAQWSLPEDEFTYAEFELQEATYNVQG